MPIIPNKKPDPPKETTGIINKPKPTGPVYPGPRKPPILLYILFGVVMLSIAVLTTYLSVFNQPVEEVSTERQIIERINQSVRIYSLIQLVSKKMEHNQNSLSLAEKMEDNVMIDTMRLSLAKNLSDLAKHNQNLAHSLAELHKDYSLNQQFVRSIFKQFIEESDKEYKVGRIEAIQEIMALLNQVPEAENALTFFESVLKN